VMIHGRDVAGQRLECAARGSSRRRAEQAAAEGVLAQLPQRPTESRNP
jgi:hypothetical protein